MFYESMSLVEDKMMGMNPIIGLRLESEKYLGEKKIIFSNNFLVFDSPWNIYIYIYIYIYISNTIKILQIFIYF